MMISVKTLIKSVAVARLDNHHATKEGQGTCLFGQPAEFIDVEQMSWSVQELMTLKRVVHTTLDGNNHNR